MFSDSEIKKIKEAWDKIKSSKRILLVSHLNPDVDALSSLGAFIEILKDYNKDYLAFANYKSSDYNFLSNGEEIIDNLDDLFKIVSNKYNNDDKVSDDFLKFFDLIIVLDCGSIERTFLASHIYKVKELNNSPFIIEFDHHVPTKTYADIEIKKMFASTTEILYDFFAINKIAINREVANCLLAGILSDTANFLYPSVSDRTLAVASNLMDLGAQFPKLLNSTWRNKNFSEMKLLGVALSNLKVNKKYNISFSILPYEDLENIKKDYTFLSSDIFGDIAGFLSNLSETDIIMLLREEEFGHIKGSLRVGASRPGININVNKLAGIFGGGGHKKASGFFIKGHIIKDGSNFKIV